LEATLITLCFILADNLQINTLKCVAGHGNVVQPAYINYRIWIQTSTAIL